jgi:hypothetical protein
MTEASIYAQFNHSGTFLECSEDGDANTVVVIIFPECPLEEFWQGKILLSLDVDMSQSV